MFTGTKIFKKYAEFVCAIFFFILLKNLSKPSFKDLDKEKSACCKIERVKLKMGIYNDNKI